MGIPGQPDRFPWRPGQICNERCVGSHLPYCLKENEALRYKKVSQKTVGPLLTRYRIGSEHEGYFVTQLLCSVYPRSNHTPDKG